MPAQRRRLAAVFTSVFVSLLLVNGCAKGPAKSGGAESTATPIETLVRQSTVTTRGVQVTARLPEGDLHPGLYPLVITLTNRSSQTTMTGPLDFSAFVRGPDGHDFYDPRQIAFFAIGYFLDAGRSRTETRTVWFLHPGVYDVFGEAHDVRVKLRAQVTSGTPAEPGTPLPRIVEQGKSGVMLYFVRGEYVGIAPHRMVRLEVPIEEVESATWAQTHARAAVKALLEGPTAADKKFGLRTTIPAGTKQNSLTLSGNIASVDLSRTFESGGDSASMALRVAQVVYTVTQWNEIGGVVFRLDGEPVTSIAGVIVSPPVNRADFEEQTPAILVERPEPGELVVTGRGSSIGVTGKAKVFEGQFNLEVKDPSGAVIAAFLLNTASGSKRGSFDRDIHLKHTRTGTGTFVFFDISEKDGSRIDVIKIPVQLE